jgi:hypothetical protein
MLVLRHTHHSLKSIWGRAKKCAPVFVVHFIEFVDQTDALVRKHQRSSFQCPLLRHYAPCHSSKDTMKQRKTDRLIEREREREREERVNE